MAARQRTCSTLKESLTMLLVLHSESCAPRLPHIICLVGNKMMWGFFLPQNIAHTYKFRARHQKMLPITNLDIVICVHLSSASADSINAVVS